MKRIEDLISSYDWSKLYISTGDAHDVPSRLRGLITATLEHEAKHWYFRLENYVVVQGGVLEAALPCLHVLVNAISYESLSEHALSYIYELFYQIVNGYPDPDAIRRGNIDIVDRCKIYVIENIEVLRGASWRCENSLFEDIICVLEKSS